MSLGPVKVLLLLVLASALELRSAAAFSAVSPSPSPTPSSRNDFSAFDFDTTTGICRRPSSFRYDEEDKETQYFVMRNVPGDGDCVFHAVLSSVFISMGMLNPDSVFTDQMSAMTLEMRRVVAQFLSSPEGTLYVTNKPVKRIVRCRDLLQSAAQNEGLSAEEYLIKLRQPGREGGLYGGGPELTVLSNILRRPISIYHLKQSTDESKDENFGELQRMGSFGAGLFEDPGQTVPGGVIPNAVFFTLNTDQSSPLSSPFKCSWHLHILIADAGDERHATILLPSAPILHQRKIQ